MENEDQRLKAFCFRETSPAIHFGLQRFYNNPQFSDLTIVAPDGVKVHVHQVVLAACSKRFSDVLDQGNLQGEELPVRGVDAAGLDAVLRFFYCGECNLDYRNVIPVYDAAHRLDVPSLVTACETFSVEALCPSTSCTLLQQALQFNMNDYAEQCMVIIRENFEEVTLEQFDFLAASFQTLARVLSDAASHQGDEGLVFKAAWRWGTAEIVNMQHLPEILRAVTIPTDLSIEELMKLSTPVKDGVEGTPAWPPLRQALVQHVIAAGGIISAVRNVAEEAASVSLAYVANNPPPSTSGRNGHGSMHLQAAQLMQQAGLLDSATANQIGMTNVEDGRQQGLARTGSFTSQSMGHLGNSRQGGGGGGVDGMNQQHLLSNRGGSLGGVMGNQAGAGRGYGDSQQRLPVAISNYKNPKGLCQVEGCYQDLAGLRDYHARYKICEVHLKAASILKEGVPQRFCQQCGRFHHLDEFDGDKRSCRARLQRHNARRRKKAGEGEGGADDQPYLGGNKLPRLDNLDAYQLAVAASQGNLGFGSQGSAGQSGSSTLEGLANLAARAANGTNNAAGALAAFLATVAQQQQQQETAGRVGGVGEGGHQDGSAAAMALLGALAAAGGGQGEDRRGAGVHSSQQALAELAANNGLTAAAAAWQQQVNPSVDVDTHQQHLHHGEAIGHTLENLMSLAAMPSSRSANGGVGGDGGHRPSEEHQGLGGGGPFSSLNMIQ
ncbi:hypothetical protein CEUSTIGMA_g4636.t1 [Chlamydomonas eustigma]|uniref:BTB domain-containing protein n=1 Tax=Chlamydomonas eustigma TaxID=1157962 RepID=A0A250X344_9CHLO|nr:hypothetical protein CEUSTIGMA_g4636.t1 [Chlamydomonas eustigma]|eukprot:GAX77190.1 hypothetical protein CEUSTIGMA_g4636.t1 [Chlamydomonas eustigma]